jgi:ubiquinone/menaquinone biosynthesis C-methylase UbiE
MTDDPRPAGPVGAHTLEGWVDSLREINVATDEQNAPPPGEGKSQIAAVYDAAAGWSMRGELWNWGLHDQELADEIERLIPGFDRFDTDTYSEQLYLLTLRELPHPLDSYGGLRVLEVGCGMGCGLNFLSRIVRAERMVGLDLSAPAVDRANATLSRGDELRYVQGDAEDLPFDDGEFDVVINVESSHNYPDLGRFLREVSRVLKPGGHLSHVDILADRRLAEFAELKRAGTGLRWLHERDVSEQVRAAIRRRMRPGSHVRELYRDKKRRLPFAIRRMGGPGGIRFYGAEFAGYRDPLAMRVANTMLGRPAKPAIPGGKYLFSIAEKAREEIE